MNPDTDVQLSLFVLPKERPKVVLHAIVGMWTSVLIGQGLNVFQSVYESDHVDMGAIVFSCVILAAAVGVQRQILAAREWARMAYWLLLVLSYSLMALDDAGITGLDMISLATTVPINLFVLMGLYGARVSRWFQDTDGNAL